MIYEKSCGAVVYRLENGRRLYLVERTPSGKTVLPKGHVEAGETEADPSGKSQNTLQSPKVKRPWSSFWPSP